MRRVWNSRMPRWLPRLLAAMLVLSPLGARARCSHYLGCYVDGPDSGNLSYVIEALPWANLTIGRCVRACASSGFKLAGLRKPTVVGGASCRCGDAIGDLASAGDPDQCDAACPGNAAERCGSTHASAVYDTREACGSAGTCVSFAGVVDGSIDYRCACGPGRSGVLCEHEGTCRFGPSFDWRARLQTDGAAQEAYIQQVLSWDGRFATPGLGLTASFLTKDHVTLDAEGRAASSGFYTAASKESLHLAMLALVLDRRALAWHWMANASDAAHAAKLALERLERIIEAYEALHAKAPGLGGFLPWCAVGDSGFEVDVTTAVELPALDNGQLAWSMQAVATVLRAAAQSDESVAKLAVRFEARVQLLSSTAKLLFFDASRHTIFSMVKVLDPKAPAAVDNRVGWGELGDPYEGVLMVMFVDLLGDWSGEENEGIEMRDRLWRLAQMNQVAVPYEAEGLAGGPITVQRGWRFSSHELWAYLVLPYLDDPLMLRLLRNGERARTWHSRLRGIPGLLASAYDVDGRYVDRFGVHSVSMGYEEPADSELMVTPYAAFPLMLADRGAGLAWHHAMLSRPRMQSLLGSVEASAAFGARPGVARKVSWDTKVTADLAALGGLGPLLGRFLNASGRLPRFAALLAALHAPAFATLEGEAVPFAPPPSLEEVSYEDLDWASCARSSIPLSISFDKPEGMSMSVNAAGHVEVSGTTKYSGALLASSCLMTSALVALG
eukprot:TRINITY_DN21529_c4_g1_i1.p1 TRINITY_DN21529_c4_g1~~TRINITY_DN21529_c4_g1_i1.p1  ORF type:complete len:770 (+),score=165.45 TRINITY_DN21529_c4_g1_i1:134-2311(+)